MTPPAAARVGLAIGAVMVALGVYVAGRIVLAGLSPLTGTAWLDIAFGVFFMARGALAYGRWKRAQDSAG